MVSTSALQKTLCFLFLLILWSCAGQVSAQTLTQTLNVDRFERSYDIYLPDYQGTQKLPLIIALHGGLGNGTNMAEMTGLNQVADSGPFVVAYPDGTGGLRRLMKDRRTWNAGACCGIAVKKNIDDISFISLMIDQIAKEFPVDPGKVYVTGISNGAMLAYRLACEIPDKIAGIIPVAGTLAINECPAGNTVPVLHIHGDADHNVPFDGGQGSKSIAGVSHRSIPDTVQIMTESRNCASPVVEDHGTYTEHSYQCEDGAPFKLVVIKGGGHSWPGGTRLSSAQSTTDYSASRETWLFAQQDSCSK